ncbi:MAG: hypothetical protein WCK09_00420 [Bacteroidota bacterium]
MLSLKLADQFVDLPDDFSFTMNLKSPIFGDVGSYSYPFRIPVTPRNARILEFVHRVESTADVYRSDPGMFLWNGLSLFQGTLKLKALNSKSYEGAMLEGEGDFFYSRKYAFLQEVDFGEMTFATEAARLTYMNECANTIYPARNIAFPQILNKTYFDELPVNTGLHYFNIYINSLLKSEFIGGVTERTILVPMLYLRFVLKKILEHQAYTFDDSFFASDSDYNALALFNLVDCNTGPYGFFQYDVNKLLLNYHLPRISINDFFLGLETFFNIRFFVNNSNKTVRLMSVDKIVKATDYTEFSKQIISVSTDLEEKITGFHLTMAMDTDDELYQPRKDLDADRLSHLKASVKTVADLNPWPADDIMDLRYVEDKSNYYILWTDKLWMPWYPTVDLYLEYLYRTADQAIETKVSSLLNANVGEPAVIGNARTGWREVTQKLFFVHYDQTDPAQKKVIARPATATNNLFFGGEYGLFNKHYKAYFDFRMSTKMVKIMKLMTMQEIKDFDFSRKYMIDGMKYLVKNIQVTIKKDRIMPALLECYTCP